MGTRLNFVIQCMTYVHTCIYYKYNMVKNNNSFTSLSQLANFGQKYVSVY